MTIVPVSQAELVARLLDVIEATPAAGRALRVALDGAQASEPYLLAQILLDGLHRRGHSCWVIDAGDFYRDASLRFEYGRNDELSYAHGWLDSAALAREVLNPLGPDGNGRFITGLRDQHTNRSLRQTPVQAHTGSVVIVAGEMLLRPQLSFDCRIHLRLSPGALHRRTPAESAWTIPILLDYENSLDCEEAHVDVTVRLDDPRHPAIEFTDRT